MGGEGRVVETMVFPYNGCVNYVVLLDPHGVPQPVPGWFTDQPLYQARTLQGPVLRLDDNIVLTVDKLLEPG